MPLSTCPLHAACSLLFMHHLPLYPLSPTPFLSPPLPSSSEVQTRLLINSRVCTSEEEGSGGERKGVGERGYSGRWCMKRREQAAWSGHVDKGI